MISNQYGVISESLKIQDSNNEVIHDPFFGEVILDYSGKWNISNVPKWWYHGGTIHDDPKNFKKYYKIYKMFVSNTMKIQKIAVESYKQRIKKNPNREQKENLDSYMNHKFDSSNLGDWVMVNMESDTSTFTIEYQMLNSLFDAHCIFNTTTLKLINVEFSD